MTGRDRGLRLSTAFDDVVPAAVLPAQFTRGDDPAVQLIDGFVRGRQRLGRFAASPAVVGFGVAVANRPVVVTVTLRLDDVAASYWTSRVEAFGGAGAPELPRLLQVRSQGRVRGAVVLCRAPWAAAGTPVRGQLRFPLVPDELPAGGLLLLELADAPPSCRAAAFPVLAHAPVGVEATEVTVEVAEAPRPAPTSPTLDAVSAERLGWLATGDLAPREGIGARTVRSGVFLLDNPTRNGGRGTVTVDLLPRSSPTTATGQPRRGGQNGGNPLLPTAVSMMDGSAVQVTLAATGGGRLRLTVSGAVSGAVAVHLSGADTSDWNIATVTRHAG